MNTFEPYPYQVNFFNKEACMGDGLTIPKYRRQGLQTYARSRILQFLRAKGVVAVRAVVPTNNIAEQQSLAKFGMDRYARARYLKVLWCQSWKEKPLAQVT